MAAVVRVRFEQHIPLPAEIAYRRLCDWQDHERWVPFTTVTVHDENTFTAYTGIGPLRLADNMRVTCRDDEAREVVVEKTGPVLTGSAGFRVRPSSAESSIVIWTEELRVPLVPGFCAPLLRVVTRRLFRRALKRFA
jgi:carbon monoxide dehydrogenase subunit G